MEKNSENKDETFKLDVVSVRLVKDAVLYSDKRINCPEDAIELLYPIMQEFDREVVCVINLNSANKPINVNFASIGALNYAIVNPRELFKTSILSNASSMILVHNHPSGSLTPSKEDIQTTDRMAHLCKLMDIRLTDHIIIGDSNHYFSFRAKSEKTLDPPLILAQDINEISFAPRPRKI